MPFNVPIFLTWLRVALIPLFVGIFYLAPDFVSLRSTEIFSTMVFMVAAATDWFDGYLARRWNQTSAFGAFLDPVADKLIVTAALLILLQMGRVDAIVAFIIVGREIAISALREWMAQMGTGKTVAVSFVGKIKTSAQMVAIPMLLYNEVLFGHINMAFWGTILMWVAAILTVWSMLYYLRRAWQQIFEQDRCD